jgi:small conductance mechanosensitive channel
MSRSDRVGDSIERFARDQGLRLLLALLGTVVAVRLVRIVLYRIRRRLEGSSLGQRGLADPGRLQALFDVFTYLGVALVVTVGAMTGLSVLGVNTGALLASAGVLGFAIGFGAQTMVRDLLNGLFLLAEGQYTIGDHITVNNVSGVVERFTLRTTTMRDSNGDVHIVASGDIRLVTNKTRGYSRIVLDVGFPHLMPIERVMELLTQFCSDMAADPRYAADLVEPPAVLGVEAIQEHQVLIRIAAKVLPHRRNDTARRAREDLVRLFEREGIEVPAAGGPAINISVPGSSAASPPSP